jgi:hypothetical protein
MRVRGRHSGYADVPGEVSEQVFRCDSSERLQPAAEIANHAPGVPHVVERAGIEAVGGIEAALAPADPAVSRTERPSNMHRQKSSQRSRRRMRCSALPVRSVKLRTQFLHAPHEPRTACPVFLGVPRSAEIDFEICRDLDCLAKMQKWKEPSAS